MRPFAINNSDSRQTYDYICQTPSIHQNKGTSLKCLNKDNEMKLHWTLEKFKQTEYKLNKQN